jgi:hypothetical protein
MIALEKLWLTSVRAFRNLREVSAVESTVCDLACGGQQLPLSHLMEGASNRGLRRSRGIAGADFSFHAFEGRKKQHNNRLHITSTRLDEPIVSSGKI